MFIRSNFMKLPLLQLNIILKEVTSAHHQKYLLIAIFPQQRASHTACLQRKVYSTQLGLQKNLHAF